MIDKFTHNEATGGVLMMFCAVLALILQNGSYSTSYRHWIEMSAGVVFGDFQLIKPLLLWINDGLITIFFFSIGLELKVEFIKGHLSNRRNIILPALAALGGIVFPSLCFIAFNYNDAYAMRGWAIPASTDTAFSIAILLLLGTRVPASLKIFLLSMAIFDDIGAIMVIALFYTSELSMPALVLASFAILCLMTLNYFGVGRRVLYLVFGLLLWFSILKSGVHATLAGIITAFFIPMKSAKGDHMVEPIAESLKIWIALVVLPIFTLANAGIDLSMINIKDFFAPVSLGIFVALVFGKPFGILLTVWLAMKARLVKMPTDATLTQIYGVCILTGIGFSMSMFVDSLAYQGSNKFNYADSLAILVGSFVSGVYGYVFLRFIACRTLAIEYRPWLPSPSGYKGTARTANLYTLDESTQGPSSVAPTAALVAEANARSAAAAAAAKAADEAAIAAKQAAEAAKEAADLENEASDETLAKVQLAAAQAAKAAASAAVSTAKLDSEESDTVEVAQAASIALEVANVATQAAQAVQAAQAEHAAQAEYAAHSEHATQDEHAAASKQKQEQGQEHHSSTPGNSQDHSLASTDKAHNEHHHEHEIDEEKKSSFSAVASKALAKVVSSISSASHGQSQDQGHDLGSGQGHGQGQSANKGQDLEGELLADRISEQATAKTNKASHNEAQSPELESKAGDASSTSASTDSSVSSITSASAATGSASDSEHINELKNEGEQTVISVNSVGFAKVQVLESVSAESSNASVSANTALKSGKNQQPSVLESEHEAIANLESKSDVAKIEPLFAQSVAPEEVAEHERAIKGENTEKKSKAKNNLDFDSDIYLSDVAGSVAAQVQKLSQEQCKTQKCVDVAKLIAKAKDIDEAMHREIDKGAKVSKASHPEVATNADKTPAEPLAMISTHDQDSSHLENTENSTATNSNHSLTEQATDTASGTSCKAPTIAKLEPSLNQLEGQGISSGQSQGQGQGQAQNIEHGLSKNQSQEQGQGQVNGQSQEACDLALEVQSKSGQEGRDKPQEAHEQTKI